MQTLTPEASSASTPTELEGNAASGTQTPEVVSPQIDAKLPEDSSTSKDAKSSEPKSMLEALQAATQSVSEETKTASSAVETGSNQAATPENPTEPNAQENSDTDPNLPFHNHPRWKAMLQERDAYKQGAQQYSQIETFMHDNGISQDEVVRMYQFAAAMKRDPIKALELIQPVLETLNQFVGGGQLPEDVARQVDDGTISRDAAAELVRRRNEAEFFRTERQRAEAQQAAFREQQAIQAQTQDLVSAATEWETQTRQRDPDYDRKSALIGSRIRELIQEHPPRDRKEALDIAQKAYDDVNASLRSFAPRQPMRTVTSAASTANSAKSAPRSLREAIFQAAGRA
jgi:hypothetical protein